MVDELSARRAKKMRQERRVFIECQSCGRVAEVRRAADGTLDKPADWFVSSGLPPVVLCPDHKSPVMR